MDSVVVGNRRFFVRRVGTNAKNASAFIRHDEIVIRIPVHWPREEGFKAFLDLQRKMTKKLEKNPLRSGTAKIRFTHGQKITVLGKPFEVTVTEGRSRISKGRINNGLIQVELASGLPDGKKAEHVSNLARRVMSRQVLPLVEKRVLELNAKHFGFTLRRVFLKETMSRWGSCSESGNINLNFALLFAPPDVLDSVIIHELAHLKEHNHSPAFWALVKKAMPNYDDVRRWLKDNSATLGSGVPVGSVE